MEAWLPIGSIPVLPRFAHDLGAIARLKPGVTLERARAETAAIAARLEQAYPDANKGWKSQIEPMIDVVVGDAGRPLWILVWSRRQGAANRLRQCGQPPVGLRVCAAAGNGHTGSAWQTQRSSSERRSSILAHPGPNAGSLASTGSRRRSDIDCNDRTIIAAQGRLLIVVSRTSTPESLYLRNRTHVCSTRWTASYPFFVLANSISRGIVTAMSNSYFGKRGVIVNKC